MPTLLKAASAAAAATVTSNTRRHLPLFLFVFTPSSCYNLCAPALPARQPDSLPCLPAFLLSFLPITAAAKLFSGFLIFHFALRRWRRRRLKSRLLQPGRRNKLHCAHSAGENIFIVARARLEEY
jgi:hypothetical protein